MISIRKKNKKKVSAKRAARKAKKNPKIKGKFLIAKKVRNVKKKVAIKKKKISRMVVRNKKSKAKKVIAKKRVSIVQRKKKPSKIAVSGAKAKKLKKVKAIAEKKTLFSMESFKPKIKVIGIGGGGGSIVSEIGRSLERSTFVIADTDVRAFKKKRGIKFFLFGNELTHGLGTGLNTALAKEAALGEAQKISALFEGQDIIIFVACLGGGLGSGATQVFLDLAKNFSAVTLGIFTLPFKFEGKNKHAIAAKALTELRKSLNVSITIPNERIFKVINEDTAITEAFSLVNKNLTESLESLIDLIQSPGLINIDFADLRAILQGSGNLAFLNTAQSSGKDKTEKLVQDIFNNPLYQDNFVPEKVLFNIEGGKRLSMFEVDKISKAVSEKNPKAKIIFGISKNPRYNNDKIKVTLLMAGPRQITDKPAELQTIKEGTVIRATAKKAEPIKRAVRRGAKSKKKTPRTTSESSRQGGNTSDNLLPVFGGFKREPDLVKKINISEKPVVSLPNSVGLEDTGALTDGKKNIRRSALEIQEAQELEKSKKTKQEEEWEIPAFLRFKKIK